MSEKRTKKTQLDNIRKGKNLLLEGIRTVGLVRNKKEEELEKVLDIRNRELLKKLFPSCGKYSPKKAEKKAEEEMENRKRRAAQILAKDAKKKKIPTQKTTVEIENAFIRVEVDPPGVRKELETARLDTSPE